MSNDARFQPPTAHAIACMAKEDLAAFALWLGSPRNRFQMVECMKVWQLRDHVDSLIREGRIAAGT